MPTAQAERRGIVSNAGDGQKGRQQALEMAIGQIEKRFGRGSIMRLGEASARMSVEAIPTGSLSLDIALGIGGIPRGRVTEIFGPEMAGKSTLAQHIVAEAQRLGGQSAVAYVDVEHALDPSFASALGVNIEDMLISQPDTGEQALEICEALIRSNAVDVIVVDSVAALVPRAEIEGDMGDSLPGLQARLMSQALRKLTAAVSRSRTALIFINQLREKIGVVFGNPEVTPGGRALKFYSSVRIDIRRIESLKQGTTFIGTRVRCKVVKNKTAAPFRQAEFDIMFLDDLRGINREGDILDLAVEHEITKKLGAFYSYGETKLGQGRENSKEFLTQHPEIAASVEGRIRGPAVDPEPESQVTPGEARTNGDSPHAEGSVADILPGATSQGSTDKE
ncbi:MAG: recombinase RecA [Chloroflexi bacterium]|nr:recombinase RecA [Chloroflexota bacterium]